MGAIETKLSLAEDAADVIALASERGAELTPDSSDPLTYWLTVHPAAAPGEVFFVRIAWSDYPHAPPSVKFADAIGGSLENTAAWPIIPGYRPGNFDICQPFTAEAFGVHPEWKEGVEAWPTTGNPFFWVVETLLSDFASRYEGRSG